MSLLEFTAVESASAEDVRPAHKRATVRHKFRDCGEVCDSLVGRVEYMRESDAIAHERDEFGHHSRNARVAFVDPCIAPAPAASTVVTHATAASSAAALVTGLAPPAAVPPASAAAAAPPLPHRRPLRQTGEV